MDQQKTLWDQESQVVSIKILLFIFINLFLATEKPVSSAEDQVKEMDIEEVIEQSKDFKCKKTI